MYSKKSISNKYYYTVLVISISTNSHVHFSVLLLNYVITLSMIKDYKCFV